MPSTTHRLRIPRDPEMFGPALAHVAIEKGDQEEVIGQAWIAAPNTVITCAHVVDQYVRSPGSIVIKFPASGNRYSVKEIKLHPSFQRHENEFLRFDLAAIHVDFLEAELNARPLPIVFEKPIEQSQDLSAVRYPSHLGLYTTSLFPLSQIGRVLGMKPNDRFHIFHDVALAPGDSGTPLFDGEHVVAVHCGDTATAPVLNIATSSIRMAVSVDALMALGISESRSSSLNFNSIVAGVFAFIISAVLTLGAFAYPHKNAWSFTKTPKLEVDIAFNKPFNDYKFDDPFSVTLIPKVNCALYVFCVQGETAAILYPPPANPAGARREANQQVIIDGFGTRSITIDESVGKLHVLALANDANAAPMQDDEIEKINHENFVLPFSSDELLRRINDLEKRYAGSVLHAELDVPRADKPAQTGQSSGDAEGTVVSDKQNSPSGNSESPEAEPAKSEAASVDNTTGSSGGSDSSSEPKPSP